MAKTVRSRRVTIAAGALSLALAAPFVSPVDVTPVAAAVDASAFNARYNTTNFWDVDEAVVQGLVLEPGDTVSATANTIFNWKFRTSGCNLIIGRPQSSTAFRTGNQDIAVQVTKADGSSFNTTLRVNVVDTRAAGNKFTEPADNCPAPTSTTTPTSDAPAPTTTTSAAEPTSAAPESSTSEAPKTTATTFNGRFDTANFWNQNEALVEGLELQPGDSVSATTNTIFNWRFRNDDGALTVIRPQSAAAFRTGEVDIPVRVTTPQGDSFTTTLRLNVIDEAPPAAYEIPPVETRETIDFAGGRSKVVDAWDVPEGVTVEKQVGFQSIGVVGWDVEVQNGKIVVKAPGTFSSGDDVDIPVTFSDGTSTADRTLRIRALNPQTTGEDIAGTVGTIVGNIIGGATGSGSVGDLVGGLIGGGGSGSDAGSGSGDGGRGGLGGLIGGLLGGGSGDGGGLLEGLVKVEVQPSAVIVTGNANPTVEIRDNGSNNGSGNSVLITDNANPRDNFSNNSVEASAIVTGNANPVVTGNLNDNGSNNSAVVTGNANPTVVITGNANPVVTGNLNDNGSNNSAVVTGNANPTVVITGNANDNFRENGSNNSAVVTGNANPTVVITGNANPVVTGNANDNFRENASNNSAVVTGNANPVITGNANPSDIGSNNSAVVTGNANPVVTGNANDNGSNNSAVVTGNANPTVVVTGNANNNGTGNTVMVTGNANPVVTGNANGGLLGSSGGSSKRGDKKDPGLVDTNLNTEGGSSDPRCIAPLVGLGLPLIPLALAQGLNIPGLDRAAKQAENAFDDATRRLNIPTDQAMAIGGGIAGVVAALLVTATVRNCIPRPKSFDVNVNVPQPQGVVTSVAPVVDTPAG